MSLEKILKNAFYILSHLWSGFLDTTVWIFKAIWWLFVNSLKFSYWILKIDSYRRGFRGMCVTSIFIAGLIFCTGVVSFYYLNDGYSKEYVRDARTK